MKKLLKGIEIIMILVLLMAYLPADVLYVEAQDNQLQYVSDDVVVRWRVHNGHKQYRRWNKTKERWIDARWIDF
ncbi:MAG: hypothetical protein E7281_03765 [Lachnospiraceae bacterium]|nr:hypothetical protein [Lachnospiraceae bacterium]